MSYEGSGSPNGPILRLSRQIARWWGLPSEIGLRASTRNGGRSAGSVDVATAQ
jgi:hypothetical protein